MRLFLLFSAIIGCSSYKFLVYSPILAYSHQKFFGKIADLLTAAGHDVTVLMPILDEDMLDHPGLKLTKKIIFNDADQFIRDLQAAMKVAMHKMLWTTDVDGFAMMEQFKNMTRVFRHGCELLVNREDIITQLRNENFDVAIGEIFGICALGFFDLIGVNRTIAAYSTASFDSFVRFIGEPTAPSYVPSMVSTASTKMTLIQRVKNLFDFGMGQIFMNEMYSEEHKIFADKYPGFKSIEEIAGQVSLLFANSNPYLNYPRPLMQKTIEIGGLTVNLTKSGTMTKEMDDLLNQRKYNVYISFGSITKSKDMPSNWKSSLIEVFSKLPEVTFIWKYEEPTNITSHLKNVYLSPWLPQTDLLGDKRLSIFVTHGGLGSITEVAYSGVPAVAIPLFAEQPRNAHMLAEHGGAIALHKAALMDTDLLYETFQKILHNPSYAQKAAYLAEVLKNKPISNEDLVVKHCEFVAKYGPLKQLDAYGRHLSLVEYYFLDVALIILAVLLTLLFLLFSILAIVCKKVCSSRKQKKE